jgi:hypothetical protein
MTTLRNYTKGFDGGGSGELITLTLTLSLNRERG